MAAIYTMWGRVLRRGLLASSRLAHPLLQCIWLQILSFGLLGGVAKAEGRICIPPGETVPSLRAVLAGSHWAEEGGTLHLLNRPSWLLGTGTDFLSFMDTFYHHTEWTASDITELKGHKILVK